MEECIENNGLVAFQNECGLSMGVFLDLLMHYLQSLFVCFEGKTFVQRSGVCIGSCVAPILSDIYLASVDRNITASLDKQVFFKVVRYVDDYLLLFTRKNQQDEKLALENALSVFKEKTANLVSTSEVPIGGQLQFLDLRLCIQEHHVCWKYSPRSAKGLLPYGSCHSKLVKRGTVSFCLLSSLRKSCHHLMSESFEYQLNRARKSGYPAHMPSVVMWSLLKKVRCTEEPYSKKKPERPVVIPYMHKISHNLKKVGARFGVPVVFSAPNKLSGYLAGINGKNVNSRLCDKAQLPPLFLAWERSYTRSLSLAGECMWARRGGALMID